MWLKGLVSIACVAVIAVAGIWLFDRFSAEAMPLNEERMNCWDYRNSRENSADNSSTTITDVLIERHCPSPAHFDATPAEVEAVCQDYRDERDGLSDERDIATYGRLLEACP